MSTKRSIQSKITLMAIFLTVIAVVLFTMIVSLRLFLVRDEIRSTGEEAAAEILSNSEIAYTMSNVTHIEEFISTNSHLVDERFGFINNVLTCLKAQAKVISDNEDSNMQTDLASSLTPFLQEIMNDQPDAFDCAMISFPNGRSILLARSYASKIGASGEILPYDVRKEAWYQETIGSNETFTISKASLPGEDTECITVSTPVYSDAGNSLVCILSLSVKTEKILNIIESSFNEEGVYPVLIDETGTILYSLGTDSPFTKADMLTTGENADNQVIRFVISYAMENTMSIEVTIDGQSYYCAFSPISNSKWAELLFLKKELFEASTNQLMDDLKLITDRTIEVSDRSFVKVMTRMLILSVILICLSIITSIILAKKITSPIKQMTCKVSEIDGEKILFEMEELFRTGDEIETLATAFEAMSQKIRRYISDIVEISTQKERMEAELNVARQIQSSMLPKDFPLFPDRTEFDVYASMEPAREVGGDFYDIFMVDKDHLALVVGDASEKGVPAALFMVISKAYIKTRALTGGTPGEILTDVNRLLAQGNEKKMFVTVWLAILEISTGRLVYANAGHEKLAIKRAGEDFALDYSKHGFILGGMTGVNYSDHEITLHHGDRIFMYTDGLTEAHKDVRDLFGTDRMLQVLNKNSELSPAELLPAITAAVNSFVDKAPQFDDLTMLTLEYR